MKWNESKTFSYQVLSIKSEHCVPLLFFQMKDFSPQHIKTPLMCHADRLTFRIRAIRIHVWTVSLSHVHQEAQIWAARWVPICFAVLLLARVHTANLTVWLLSCCPCWLSIGIFPLLILSRQVFKYCNWVRSCCKADFIMSCDKLLYKWPRKLSAEAFFIELLSKINDYLSKCYKTLLNTLLFYVWGIVCLCFALASAAEKLVLIGQLCSLSIEVIHW